MLYIHFTAEVNEKSINKLISIVVDNVNKGEKELTLLLSTPGGQITWGLAAFNTFKMLPITKIFWNIGNIDSIGVMLFLAGDERYCVPNSRFLFHDVSLNITGAINLSESNLRLNADSISHDRNAIAELSATVTKQDANLINDMMKNGKIANIKDAKDLGYIHEEKLFTLPEGQQIIIINSSTL